MNRLIFLNITSFKKSNFKATKILEPNQNNNLYNILNDFCLHDSWIMKELNKGEIQLVKSYLLDAGFGFNVKNKDIFKKFR